MLTKKPDFFTIIPSKQQADQRLLCSLTLLGLGYGDIYAAQTPFLNPPETNYIIDKPHGQSREKSSKFGFLITFGHLTSTSVLKAHLSQSQLHNPKS
jgi:hypothetical protein